MFIMAAAALTTAAACQKTPEVPAVKAARAEVTISNYFNEEGTKSMKTWESRDMVAFVNTVSENPKVTTTPPMSTGSQTSRFIFSTDAKEGDNIAAYYPAAEGTYANGKIQATVPTQQNGTVSPFYAGTAAFTETSQKPVKINIDPVWCTVYADVAIGDYAIKKAELKGNNGEKIAGAVEINTSDMSVAASATSVSVEFPSAVDCRIKGFRFPILIAPVTFSKGYTITFTSDSGESFSLETSESIEAERNGSIVSGGAKGKQATQLLVCGDNMIYHIDARIAAEKGFDKSVIWQWDAKSVMGIVGKGGIRLDDCKPVDNNTKILATSSQDYAVLLDKEKKEMLWYTNVSDNAHSGELLPNNRIAIACSDGGDCIQIFDIAQSNKVLFSTPLVSAHGVVWNEKHQRLFAIGGTSLNIYKLTDWETASPKLTLEKTVNTKDYVTGLHDLTYVDANTILVAGKYSALYDIEKGTFMKLARFNASTQLKAVNYNSTTGECWYVDATNPEGEFTWSSKTVHYTDNVQSSDPDKLTIVNVPLNMYKARVLHW